MNSLLRRKVVASSRLAFSKTSIGDVASWQGPQVINRLWSSTAFPRIASRSTDFYRLSPRYLSTKVDKSRIVFNDKLLEYLEAKRRRYQECEEQLSSGGLTNSQMAQLGKEMSALSGMVELLQRRDAAVASIAELRSVEDEERRKGSEGEEMASLAMDERAEVEAELSAVESEVIELLTPRDLDDDRNIILEVRAGTGGDEASLFAGEVFHMYQKFAGHMNWKWEELSNTATEIGGFKEAQASISGNSVFKYLKFESGVHRVQRIPVNDTKIQTSAASVIVMPEAGDLDVTLNTSDIRIDVFRSSGAGGQSVQKTESAVRMTHIPTGIVVTMQDERSQIQNRLRAMKILRSRIYDLERSRQQAALSEMRSAAGGTGDRSDKIRTYNFPQDRVTDHRAGVTITGVHRVMNGNELATIAEQLNEADIAERFANLIEQINS